MQKITIENFGPVKRVQNLPIHNITLLIGQQASGKSTISKLIYFFKSLKEDVFQCLEEHQYVEKLKKNDIETTQLKLFPKLKVRFYTFFGSTKYDNFSITYEYKEDLKVTITPDGSGAIQVAFSDNWYQKEFFRIIKNWNGFLHEEIKLSKFPKIILNGIDSIVNDLIKNRKKNELDVIKELINKQINALFGENEIQERRLFYIPAGRSLLSSFKQAAQSKIMNGGFIESAPFSEKSNKNVKSHFEFFVRDFFERIDTIKTEILYGKSLEEVIETFALLDNRDYSKAKTFHQKIKQILKADYQVDAYGERLVSSQFSKSIKLDFASSGQQEVIWILLQLFVLILENRPSFVVIEEPEAHLYPTAQVEIMNLIALFLNAHPDNQLIVTTHSPYMLTATNNLLFAHRVASKVGKKAAIAQAIGTESWINPDSFGAYYLSDENMIDIFNKETGVIAESELDDASENIMSVFDNLMDIYKS